MKPVIIGDATLFLGDCMTYMATLPDKAFQLAVCDPPYGVGQPKQRNLKNYNGREHLNVRLEKNRLNSGSGKLKNRVLNNSNASWDDAIPTDEYFAELRRVSVNQIIWGGNYFPLPPTRCVIAWDKVQPWENFSQWEMAWTSFNSPAALFKFDNRTGDKIHPTQKPRALYEWLLTRFAKPGDRILDTHLGSMSSVIAALGMGFQITGCEKDSDYFEAGCKRVQDSQRQQPIFEPTPAKQEQAALI